MDRVNFELDSPLFKKACYNLGIDASECEKRTYESFCEKGLSEIIVDIRWKHYRARLFQTLNAVLEER